jgi:hypothetical protein
MGLRKALLDLTNFLWIIMLALTIIAGYYFAFQSLKEPLAKMIEENGKMVLVVKGSCPVAVIRQT